MKRSYLIIVLSILAVAGLGLWLIRSTVTFAPEEVGMQLVAILLVVFALWAGLKKIRSESRGQPAEDEYTKSITRRAAALSYYISLYLWLAMSFFSDHSTLPTHTIIGLGILIMAASFALAYLFYYFKGIRNA